MRVVRSPEEFNVPDLFVDLTEDAGHRLLLKCEGFNFGGSIKLKAAVGMVRAAEDSGLLRRGATIVESSSGNLGVALSIVAAGRGYGFICVTDANCTLSARRLMQTFGAQVQVITKPDPAEGGYVGARIARVRRLCAEHPDYVWLNQYENPQNWGAHFRTTGPEILRAFPDVAVLFVGTGTAGTLMGCARYLRAAKPAVRIVAVDTVGSVTFGGPAAPRMIPGVGSAVRSRLLDEAFVDDVVMVTEAEAATACWTLARRGFLFGGSTGTVVSGALDWLARNPAPDGPALAIAPDLGERYLDTVFRPAWVAEQFGAQVLEAPANRLAALDAAAVDHA
jgi:cysteine synthase A